MILHILIGVTEELTEEIEPVAEAPGTDAPGPPRPHLLRLTVWFVAVTLAVLLPVVLWATRPYGPLALPPPPGAAQAASPTGTTPGASGSGGGPAGVQAATSTAPGAPAGAGRPSASHQSPPPVPSALTAAYATVGGAGPLGLTGYRGRLTISNPGQVTVTGWTVTIKLPSGASVTAANGAEFTQRGPTVTFNPTAGAASVPGRGSVQFTFDVASVLTDAPTECTIDSRPCT
jgi:hypothetical protein